TPTSGEISYFSDNFFLNRTKCLAKIGYASGYERLPHRLSVYENLDIVGRIYGLSANTRKQQIELLLKSFDIWDKRDAETGSLSAGQSTRVMLSKAFIARPEIILLDEPTASLDPDIAIEVRKFILEYKKNTQSAFLIASHNMDEVAELCGRILVLKKGEIIANNSPAELVKTISQTHVHLHITENLSAALEQLKHSGIIHTNLGAQISITIDEHQVARLLSQLASVGANYSSISIDKPSLEDYFLSLTKKD
ncbi:ABC transporter ATP-binding protein, partial [Candidatus Dependentiae bacterium]|nr:ABC transporter ATP-binding protein [Candidatus Dependentiae bacterium]